MVGDKGGLSIESNKHKEGGSSACEIWNLQNYLTSTFDLKKETSFKIPYLSKYYFSIVFIFYWKASFLATVSVYQIIVHFRYFNLPLVFSSDM